MSFAQRHEWLPAAQLRRWLLSLVLLDCAVLLVGASDAADPLVRAGLIVATVGQLALASIPTESSALLGQSRHLSRFARNSSGLTRQCDPGAAGHVRSRAPGLFA